MDEFLFGFDLDNIWCFVHCVAAVQFMWDCLFESLERSKKPEKSAGCILAHCMGLGKTLSVSLGLIFSNTFIVLLLFYR